MDIITFTREELRDLLNVTETALKGIVKRKKLEERILDVGYKLVNSYKIGRDNYYELELIKSENKTKQLEDYQKEWKIKKKKENEVYVTERVNNLEKSVTSILKSREELKDVKHDTGRNWDKKLVDSNIITINGFVYFAVYPNGKMQEISKDVYSLYWNENAWVTRTIQRLNKDKTDGLISEDCYDQKKYELQRTMENTYGYIARRYRSYKEAEDFEKFVKMLSNRVKSKEMSV